MKIQNTITNSQQKRTQEINFAAVRSKQTGINIRETDWLKQATNIIMNQR